MDIAGGGKWSRTRAERYRKVRREEEEEKVEEDEVEIGGSNWRARRLEGTDERAP